MLQTYSSKPVQYMRILNSMSISLLREYIAILVEIRSKKGVNDKLGKKFDMAKFKQLDNFHMMNVYASTFLDKMGVGSSRAAYVFSSRYVLKIAINEKGIAQNKTEVDVFTNPNSKDVVAKVYSADTKFMWIVSDLVKPISTEGEFKSISGVRWSSFIQALETYLHNDTDYERPEGLPTFVKGVIDTMLQNHLMLGDLDNVEHWGKTPDGRCVLLDYGFTHEVWEQHYSQPKASTTKDVKTADIKTTGKKKPPPLPNKTTSIDSDDIISATKKVG
jgi:hypothetical protein